MSQCMAFSFQPPGTVIPPGMTSSSVPPSLVITSQHRCRSYRLVDSRGEPHPVLDDLYDSLDAAWSEAVGWWENQDQAKRDPIGIGIEVSTTNGDWRTIRYPGS
jgi:hypothetical protein